MSKYKQKAMKQSFMSKYKHKAMKQYLCLNINTRQWHLGLNINARQ